MFEQTWGPPCLFRKSLPVEAFEQAHLPARPLRDMEIPKV